MLALIVAAWATCCAAWALAFVRLAMRPRPDAPARPAAPLERLREEDGVRPAILPSGERIWLETHELFWHEIVCWPPRKRRAGASTQAQSGSAR